MWDNALLLRNIANVLFGFCILTMLYGTAYYIVHLPWLFPLRSVRLGAAPERVVAAEVLAAVRSEVQGNLFVVDIERLRQSLERVRWVRSVMIRREFPDRLMVRLEEHRALARWNNSALVNVEGEVFVAESDREMPNFIGQAEDSKEIAQRYLQFKQQLAALNLQISQLSLSPRHAWQMRLSNGLVLELGREEIQQRLDRFVAAYPYSLAEKASSVRYVDMRYHNGFAVGGG